MELSDRILRFLIARHGDERETARFAGELILHQHDFADGAGLAEEILKIWLGGVEREIPDVEFVTHLLVLCAWRGLR